MGKSTTKRRSDFEKAQEAFVDFSTVYLKNWTEKQLKTYITEPVVIPIGDYGFFVGPYRISGVSKNCWAVKQIDGRHIHDFVSKANAIVYCLRAMKNRSECRDILELDRQLGKLDNDIVFYKYTMENTKNKLKNEIVLNRYIDAKLQRRTVLESLKKTIILAKYLNFRK